MFVSGFIALKSLRWGSLLGCVGFVLMLFYFGPAMVKTIHEIIIGRLILRAVGITQLVLIVGIPMITLLRLIWNVKKVSSARA